MSTPYLHVQQSQVMLDAYPKWLMQVLQEDKGFVKALSRRGKARNGMGHTDGALQALSDGLQKEHNLRPASIHAQVLQEDRGNVKALFRRGKAHNGMGHTDEALQDLQAAAKLVPADKAVSREIQAVKAAMKRDREVKCGLSSPSCMIHRHAGVR